MIVVGLLCFEVLEVEPALPSHNVILYGARAHAGRGIRLHALEVAHQSSARRCRHVVLASPSPFKMVLLDFGERLVVGELALLECQKGFERQGDAAGFTFLEA